MPGCGGDRLLRLASPGKGALGGWVLISYILSVGKEKRGPRALG